MDGTVHFDVYIVTNLEHPQVGGEWDKSLLPKPTSKLVAGVVAETVAARHFRSPAEGKCGERREHTHRGAQPAHAPDQQIRLALPAS